MPLILLAFAFILKLIIDRQCTLPDAIAAILDLPTDIAFFSLSVIVGVVIVEPGNKANGIMWFAIFIVLTVITVLLWRRSVRAFNAGHRLISIMATFFNYAITLGMAVYAINLAIGE